MNLRYNSPCSESVCKKCAAKQAWCARTCPWNVAHLWIAEEPQKIQIPKWKTPLPVLWEERLHSVEGKIRTVLQMHSVLNGFDFTFFSFHSPGFNFPNSLTRCHIITHSPINAAHKFVSLSYVKLNSDPLRYRHLSRYLLHVPQLRSLHKSYKLRNLGASPLITVFASV